MNRLEITINYLYAQATKCAEQGMLDQAREFWNRAARYQSMRSPEKVTALEKARGLRE